MKKFLPILFILLASCTPAAVEVTVTPAPTVTPVPTATVIPTPTLAPDFIALQETIAQTDNYTLMGNGQIEAKQPDGTVIPVPGIRLNKDGKSYTIMVDGKEVTIDVNDVTITDENGVQVKGYQNNDGDDEYEKFVKSQAQIWAEANGGGFDLENGVAWDNQTGLVIWAKDAKGEWVNYPDGNVSIPPGPGYENEPPLLVPYYHSFNEAMAALTNELPWGEIPNVYREKQETVSKRQDKIYWKPIRENGTWRPSPYGFINLYASSNPTKKAQVFVREMQLPDGSIQLSLRIRSNVTDNYFKDVFILGDAKEVFEELKRIDACVQDNEKASNLAELCASEIVTIPAPAK